ncbi:hypothetical protein RRG08_017360 [Elysia crispata]|uniref:Uncharacterized protein n=1 Tax=Elysia crispata TaxID=231223 RepID=A0AAE1AM23_9GAST|nr:hypothetical protein RRG08_017360 [Elysia crispata]
MGAQNIKRYSVYSKVNYNESSEYQAKQSLRIISINSTNSTNSIISMSVITHCTVVLSNRLLQCSVVDVAVVTRQGYLFSSSCEINIKELRKILKLHANLEPHVTFRPRPESILHSGECRSILMKILWQVQGVKKESASAWERRATKGLASQLLKTISRFL